MSVHNAKNKVFRHTSKQTTEVLQKRKTLLYEENKAKAVQVYKKKKRTKPYKFAENKAATIHITEDN